MISFQYLAVVAATAAVAVVTVSVQGYVVPIVSTSASTSTSSGRTTSPLSPACRSCRIHHRQQQQQFDLASFQASSSMKTKSIITRLQSSQWEDDDEGSSVTSSASFEEAGKSLQDEDDEKQLAGMGDFDSNPSYSNEETERLRRAIRERTEAMGLKKSALAEETKKELEERAKARIAAARAGEPLDDTFGGIDLSKISQEAPRGRQQDDNLPSMFYEPELEMTPEEMAEADPVGQMSIPEQFMDTMKTATWPKLTKVFKDVFILVTTILLSALLLVGWDGFLRDTYTSLKLIPTPEQITQPADNLVLPDGWTDNMSEDDLMKFQDDTVKKP